MRKHLGRDNEGRVCFSVCGMLEGGLTAETARLTNIVKGLDLRMIKATGGIESVDRERDRKEQCRDKMDEGRRLR